jgi:hypothetical protein
MRLKCFAPSLDVEPRKSKASAHTTASQSQTSKDVCDPINSHAAPPNLRHLGPLALRSSLAISHLE